MRVSVALCTYEGERFLDEQLRSIAMQTRPPDEIVLCDDASTDGTSAIVQRFRADAPCPMQVDVNATRVGYTRNFARAIERCDGEVIVLADQDDVWLPRRLEATVDAFAADDTTGLVFSDAELIDEHGDLLDGTCWARARFDERAMRRVESGGAFGELLERTSRAGGLVTGATMAFRTRYRDLVLPLPGWMPSSGKGPLIHDAWITLLVAAVAPVTPIAEPLVRYRSHGDQQVGLGTPSRSPAASGSVRVARFMSPSTGRAPRRLALDAVCQRLVDRGDSYDTSAAVALLGDRLRHMDARDALPRRRMQRVMPIYRELRTGGYRTYASGYKSALRDLVQCTSITPS